MTFDMPQMRIRMFLPLVATALFLFAGCGGDDDGASEPSADHDAAGAAYSHVHGLGVEPGDDTLLIATHEGLLRSHKGSDTAQRVGTGTQDLMGFTVRGADDYLASGHPGAPDEGPHQLGLIRSQDGGATWAPVSLSGKADFHILRSGGDRVYGVDSASGRFLVSTDRGQTWGQRDLPGETADIAVDPGDDSVLVASTTDGIQRSGDAGRTWRQIGESAPVLLGWQSSGRLYSVDGEGSVSASGDDGRSWSPAGKVSGQPTAIVAGGGSIYVALRDNTIVESSDNGTTWTPRVTPAG